MHQRFKKDLKSKKRFEIDLNSSQSFPRVTAIHVVVVIVGAFVGSAGFGFSDVIVNICLNVLWTNNFNEEALLQSLLCLLLM